MRPSNFALIVLTLAMGVTVPELAAPPTTKPDAKAALELVLPPMNFAETPASDVMDFLRDITAVRIDVDWAALEKAGVTRQTPLTLKAKNEKFSAVLDRLLAGLHAKQPLGYEPDGDTVRISTKSELSKGKK